MLWYHKNGMVTEQALSWALISKECVRSLTLHGLLTQGGWLRVFCAEVGSVSGAHCPTGMLWTRVTAAVHFVIQLIGIRQETLVTIVIC